MSCPCVSSRCQLTHQPCEPHDLHPGAPHPRPVDGERCRVVPQQCHRVVQQCPLQHLQEAGVGVDDLRAQAGRHVPDTCQPCVRAHVLRLAGGLIQRDQRRATWPHHLNCCVKTCDGRSTGGGGGTAGHGGRPGSPAVVHVARLGKRALPKQFVAGECEILHQPSHARC